MNFHVPSPEDGEQHAHLAKSHRPLKTATATQTIDPESDSVPPIDPSLGPGGSSNADHPLASSEHLPSRGDGMHPPCLPDVPRSALTPSTPSLTRSPRHSVRSPSLTRQALPPFHPTDRSLPARDVSVDTVDEAYAQFILYCNPVFPLTVNTSELKKIFRQPPKSDGKSFSVWHLHELVKKYEDKEIKTWVELALELGVEKPALDKGQSTQKVQQYSVRLKRWMRAMHVDAFFDFLRGVPKEYYTHVAPPHDPFPEGGRDGVPAEEDLALRALDPSLRPKRGRRKADDIEDDESRAMTPDPKRVESAIEPSPSPFAVPQVAYSHDYTHDHDPWTAASAITPASFLAPHSAKGLTPHSANPGALLRWRVSGPSDTPITPHPLSALTPASAHPGWDEEPQSAITPRGKSRRRHGPLVSSAWASTASTASGKLRGRPPGNRTVRDGPFTTFPAKPDASPPEQIEAQTQLTTTTAPPANFPPPLNTQHVLQHENLVESPVPQSSTSTQPPSSAKRERLQLTVPKRPSGPVQLITPPTTGASATPTVLVNGKETAGAAGASPPPRRGSVFFGEEAADGGVPPYGLQAQQSSANTPVARTTLSKPASFAVPRSPLCTTAKPNNEDVKRGLAHDLLRATLTGRKRKRLRGHEAKGLAAAMLSRIPTTDGALISTWLGVSPETGTDRNTASRAASEGKKIHCHRFRVGDDGYDSPIDDDDDTIEEEEANAKQIVRETFDVCWTVSLGGLSGSFNMTGLTMTAVGDTGGDGGDKRATHRTDAPPAGTDWRQRWEMAQLDLQAKEEEVRKLRDKVLDAVL